MKATPRKPGAARFPGERPADRGQDKRHVDLIWPLWNLLDMTPQGRGTGWWPKLSYETR